ncbi:MAG: hypothetical protein EXR59_02265 [Dehalococcoidia bacterium]|nr:hypothetical protein [Dehalococcoidia bacterium]
MEDAESRTPLLQKLRHTNEIPVGAARRAHAERGIKMMRSRTMTPYFDRSEVMVPAKSVQLAEFEAHVVRLSARAARRYR